jgi:hypothetical protein
VLLAVLAVYGVAIGVLAWLGLYTFFWKTLLLPGLVLAAVLSRRPLVFLNDWSLFLCQLVLFDSLRGYIYAVVSAFRWPVYMGYAIRWEEALFGGITLPGLLQSLWHEAGRIGVLDRLLVVVHGSHFMFFLYFGLAIWHLRPEHFARYTTSLAVLLYAGLAGYVVVPTVPPWMASEPFHVLPAIRRIIASVYNALPTLQRAFDTNPVAAMPSLHAAIPTLCCLVGIRHFRWAAFVLVGYLLLVCLAIVYLGEHYFVDVLAGMALAVGVYWLMYETSVPGRVHAWLSPGRAPRGDRQSGTHLLAGRARALVALALLCLSEAIGHVAVRIREPFKPSRSFVERELLNRSDVGHFYLGVAAMEARDHAAAAAAFAVAVTELRSPGMRARAQELLGWNAFTAGRYATAADALSQLPSERLTDAWALMLGIAQVRAGRSAEGYRILTALAARAPRDPTPLYWLTRLRFLDGQITREQAEEVVRQLLRMGDGARGAELGRDLARVLEGSRSDGAP